jgi:hypothetical protein
MSGEHYTDLGCSLCRGSEVNIGDDDISQDSVGVVSGLDTFPKLTHSIVPFSVSS